MPFPCGKGILVKTDFIIDEFRQISLDDQAESVYIKKSDERE